jgi:hypothetical protein
METMAGHLSTLEQHRDLDPVTIQKTSLGKLLKRILKLKQIPQDAEFRFSERCKELLAAWSKNGLENGSEAG